MSFLWSLLAILLHASNGSFSCDCGQFLNTEKEAKECLRNIQDSEAKNAQQTKKPKKIDDKIVGGYDVDKRCLKRPSLAYIMLKSTSGDTFECMGSIINKKFVLTAAHCFCSSESGSKCQENNGAPTMERYPSGHIKYAPGSIVSKVDPGTAKKVTIIIPGRATSYNKDFLESIIFNNDESGYRKVKEIIIHPEFIIKKREENDIALVEVQKPFDFSSPLDISPICLANPVVKSDDTVAYATGYGRIFESTTRQTSCNTGPGGPSEFEPCRKFFVDNGEPFDTSSSCNTNLSPANRDKDCTALQSRIPELKEKKSILLKGGKSKTCYPVQFNGQKSWCAVCVPGARLGEAGYCMANQTFLSLTDEEANIRADVSASQGWGYCDKMCYSQKMFANKLQEAQLNTLCPEECKEKTKSFLSQETKMKKRPNPELEICAAKRQESIIPSYILDGGEYKFVKSLAEVVWGGSDTCQGDSGGPLWTIHQGKAYLIGVTNRGTGCARKDSFAIYARITYHWDWIQKTAKSGSCGNKESLSSGTKMLPRSKTRKRRANNPR